MNTTNTLRFLAICTLLAIFAVINVGATTDGLTNVRAREFTISLNSQECMDLETSRDKKVIIAKCDSSSANQKFQFIGSLGSPSVSIKTALLGCIEVPNSYRKRDGEIAVHSTCNEKTVTQHIFIAGFGLQNLPKPNSTLAVTTKLQMSGSGNRCLDARDRPVIKQYPCDGSANQNFQIKNVPSTPTPVKPAGPSTNVAAAALTDAQKLKIWNTEEMKRIPRTVDGIKFTFTHTYCPTGCNSVETQPRLMLRGETPGINGKDKAESHKPALLDSYCRSHGLKYNFPMEILIYDDNIYNKISLKPADCNTRTPSPTSANVPAAALTDAQKLKNWDAEEMKRLPRTVNGTEFMFTTIFCPTGCDYKVVPQSTRLSIRGKTPGINGQASINKAKSHRPALLAGYCRSQGLKYGLPLAIYINNGNNTSFHEINFKPADCNKKAPPSTTAKAEQAYWDLVKNSKDVADLRSYISTYPTGAHVALARLKINQLNRKPPITTPTPVKPTGSSTNAKAEQAYWDLVKNSKDVADLRSYISTYPTGAHVALARLKINQLNRKPPNTTPTPVKPAGPSTNAKAEQAYWDLVKDSKSVADLRSYISAYPTGAHVALANLKINRLNRTPVTTPTPVLPSGPSTNAKAELAYWNLVKDSTSVADLRSYLKLYPTGAHVALANLKISQLNRTPVTTPTPVLPSGPSTNAKAELAYWNLVKDSKSVADLQSYISAYPTGANVALARLKINQLNRCPNRTGRVSY